MRSLLVGTTLLCVCAWGTAFAADAPGVGNFHQVCDRVYRGAQPSSEGFQSLAKLGIKTVLDLRGGGSRAEHEKKLVEAAGMHYVNIPFSGFHAPSNEQVMKVLALFDDAGTGPVFVHCRRGADRTGTVVACYRVLHDHWTNQKALSEAKADGMSWTERAMQSYVRAYQPPPAAAAPVVAAAVN